MSVPLKTPRPLHVMSVGRPKAADRITRALDPLRKTQPLVLVAIDGRGGSGKSTLARALNDHLKPAIVQVDDFYRVMDERERYALNPRDGHMQYFDWQRLRSQVLEPLRRNEPARYERYDWVERKLGATAEVPPADVVIIEGVGSIRPELRSFYDYAIYVQTPRDVCTERLLARSDERQWIDRWNAAHDWYEQHHAPAAAADLIVE
jgi:uridine kinase